MRPVLILSALALAAALAAPAASADHYCEPGTVVDVAGQAYVEYKVLEDGYLFQVAVYLESNGEPGLQRGGVSLLGDPSVCQDSAIPDERIA